MKIALVNYRYFVSGGPERYLFNVKEVLEKNGHEVVPFSIKHKKNIETPYESFFLNPIGKGTEIYSHEFKKNLKTISQVTVQMIYSFNAKKKFTTFLKATKPDVIYILHFQNKISCSIIDAAKELRIPIVQRISDFGHICPSAVLYRENIGICEDCLTKGLVQSVKHKCINNSYIASSIKAFSLFLMNQLRIKDKIDAFIFPSTFTLQKYKDNGFKSEKLFHIPTFYNSNISAESSPICYEKYALFIGRISREKGIETLINAFVNTDFNLKIIGSSKDCYDEILKENLAGKNHHIEFLGKMNFIEITDYLRNCMFTIVPSVWYENFPNTILESFAFKKAVVATNIGSLPELVNDNTGYTFDYQKSDSLKEKITFLFDNPNIAKKLGENGFLELKNKYFSESHYIKLIKLFEEIIAK